MNTHGSSLDERSVVRERVMRMVRQSCSDDSCPIESMLSDCVDWTVDRRWPSPVETVVPLLAVRDAQEFIRKGARPELSGIAAS